MLKISTAPVKELWTDFSWGVFNLLTHPRQITAAILVVLILSLLISSVSWRRRLVSVAIGFLVSYWLLISPPVAALAVKGLVTLTPPDLGETADLIVVLGRGLGLEPSRHTLAIQLWQKRRAPKIFLTGYGNLDRFMQRLEQNHLPPDIASGTDCVLTTHDEAVVTAAMLGPQGVKRIILVTDAPHMLRSLLTFQGVGFSVIPHISPLPSDLSSVKQLFLAGREYLGLASYAVLGRFQSQPETYLEHPPRQVLKELSSRQCQVHPVTASMPGIDHQQSELN